MRNHPYLTTLDGESFMDALDSQQDATVKEQQKDLLIRTYSAQTQTSHLENKAMATPLRRSVIWRNKQQQMPSPENEFGTPGHPPEDPMSGAIDKAADDVQEELEREPRIMLRKKQDKKKDLRKECKKYRRHSSHPRNHLLFFLMMNQILMHHRQQFIKLHLV
jgi:hypothetical protein